MKQRLLILAALSVGLISCPGREADNEETSGEGSAESAETNEPQAVEPVVVPTAEELVGAPMPVLGVPQPCASDDECRVVQPSDWSPAVECCYDYPCSLDYLAINADYADLYRAWQRANPFDCAEFSQEIGPCRTQAVTCGLSQDPPGAACIEGMCQLVLPDRWPAVDPQAQTCGTDGDCVPYRLRDVIDGMSCCPTGCEEGDWVAITRATRGEFIDYIESNPPECGEWCPDERECDFDEPDVSCDGGYCVLQ